jgi:plasmid stabilization system protein ParE
MSKSIKILWDDNAKADLKLIYDFIKLKSLQGAKMSLQILYFRVKIFIITSNTK